MKKILSYILLCIYAMIMVKPVMPTISDVFAHIFNYSDHMSTVHHDHGGKSHVHYEYIEAAKKNAHGESPSNNTSKKTDDSSEHILFTTLPGFAALAIQQNYLNSHFQDLPTVSVQTALRPPITCL